jgi:hypothetical protein
LENLTVLDGFQFLGEFVLEWLDKVSSLGHATTDALGDVGNSTETTLFEPWCNLVGYKVTSAL